MELFNLTFDLGGVLSLVATLVIFIFIMWKFRIHKDFFETLEKVKKDDPFRIFSVLILLLIAFISLWLTVRVIGLYAIKNYIKEVNYLYQTENIFLMVAYLLTTNLCFTLLRALTPKGKAHDGYVLRELLGVAIQSVIIGLITFIPRYTVFAGNLDSSIRYLIIAFSLLITIVVLMFARQRLGQSS